MKFLFNKKWTSRGITDMIIFKKKLNVVAGSILICASFSAQAIIIGYTNEAAWLSDAGSGLSSENFDSFGVDTDFSASALDIGGFSVTYNGTIPAGSFNYIDALPASSPNNLFDSNALIGGVLDGETITFTFDTAITAFGAQFAFLNDFADRSVFEVAGETFQLAQNLGPVIEFFGVVSDTAFTEFTIRGLPASEGFGMDDLMYSSTSVPEPSIIWLLGSGLALIGFARRKAHI